MSGSVSFESIKRCKPAPPGCNILTFISGLLQCSRVSLSFTHISTTEKMLFLGTEEYPKEGSFEQFLQNNSGRSNAFTDSEDTVYYFDMDAEGECGNRRIRQKGESKYNLYHK